MSSDVILHAGESQESLLRRFQKMVQTSGILKDFEPTSDLCRNVTPICSRLKIMPEETSVRVVSR